MDRIFCWLGWRFHVRSVLANLNQIPTSPPPHSRAFLTKPSSSTSPSSYFSPPHSDLFATSELPLRIPTRADAACSFTQVIGPSSSPPSLLCSPAQACPRPRTRTRPLARCPTTETRRIGWIPEPIPLPFCGSLQPGGLSRYECNRHMHPVA